MPLKVLTISPPLLSYILIFPAYPTAASKFALVGQTSIQRVASIESKLENWNITSFYQSIQGRLIGYNQGVNEAANGSKYLHHLGLYALRSIYSSQYQ